MDPLLETDNANDSDFQSKIAQQTTDIVLDRKSLFLEYLLSGEERPSFLVRRSKSSLRAPPFDSPAGCAMTEASMCE